MTVAPLALTGIMRSRLIGRGGERLGQVRDVVTVLQEGSLPRVSGVVAAIGKRDVFVPASDIAALDAGAVLLSVDRLDLRGFERRAREILLGRDLLNHHVINVRGGRLARVRDVDLTAAEGEYRVTGIRVGTGSTIGRFLLRSMGDGRHDAFVEWSNIEPLLGHVPTARRKLPFRRLARLHPAALADMVEAASPAEGEEILEAVGEDPELEADVFEELDPDYQYELLRTRTDDEVVEILSNMSADDAADIVVKLGDEHRSRLLARLPAKQLTKIRGLLGYHPETAGGLMSPDFLVVPASMTVAAAVDMARTSELPATAIETIYIEDGARRLIGSIRLGALLRRDPESSMDEAALHEPVAARPHTDIPEMAIMMSDFNLESLPVVDGEHRIVGVVAVDDLLAAVVPRDWRTRVQHYASEEPAVEPPATV